MEVVKVLQVVVANLVRAATERVEPAEETAATEVSRAPVAKRVA